MNIEVFCLCDAATNDAGKLNVLGAFDTIWADKAPVVHPQCAVACRIRFESIEKGNHQLNINIVNADGKHMIPPLNSNINVVFPENQPSGSANFVLNIQGLKLEQFGILSVDLAIDGRQEASLPIYIKERKAS